MRSLRVGVVVCLLLLSVPSWSQQGATSSGAVVLQRARGVLVGTLILSDVTLTGTARRIAGSDDETGSVVLKAKATGEARMDVSLPSGQRREIRAELARGPAGNWVGPDGAIHLAAQHNCFTDAAWFFPVFLSVYVTPPNTQVTYVGAESLDGASVQHFRTTKIVPGDPRGNPSSFVAQLSQMEVYLDSQSLLPVAITYNIHPDANGSSDIPVEIRYSGYQSVNGSQVPFHVQQYIQNGLALDITITSATFNSGLSSADFPVQ